MILRVYLRKAIGLLVLVVMVTACGKDNPNNPNNPDNPNNPYNPVSDPEGTILVAMRNENNGRTYVNPDGTGGSFYIDGADNFAGSYWQFATIGKVSGLGAVTHIPPSGFAGKVAVIEGSGYVGRFHDPYYNDTVYVRLYVNSYMLAAGTNGIIGAYVKYQSPFVP